jgi:hypothetical protein
MEELLQADAGDIPWQAKEFLKFEPSYV